LLTQYFNISFKMKKIVALFLGTILLSSCSQDIQTNTPGFQAKVNNTYWRAKDVNMFINENGGITITANTRYSEITIATTASVRGVYVLGTTNQNNYAAYYSDREGFEDNYQTSIFPGPVNKIAAITASGSGYVQNTGALTSGGSGSGLKLAIETTASGNVNKVSIVARGNGYLAGDIVTIVGGNNNAKVRILNVQQSNGEIKIEKVENGLYTGTFKFNAVNEEGEVVTFSQGNFYKISLGS